MRISRDFRYFAMPLFVLMLGFVSMLAMPTGAWSADLHAAKAAGLVGEKPSGYLGVVQANAGADVRALVADVNGKRRAHYQAIATRNGTTLQAVEVLAGRTAQEKTAPGQYIMNASGRWMKK